MDIIFVGAHGDVPLRWFLRPDIFLFPPEGHLSKVYFKIIKFLRKSEHFLTTFSRCHAVDPAVFKIPITHVSVEGGKIKRLGKWAFTQRIIILWILFL